MLSSRKTDLLLADIRNGKELSVQSKLNLIIGLSIPSILAQVSSVLMSLIDASMVGSLGAKASAAIGLIQSTTWLFGGLTTAAVMGFSVQVAHFLGARDPQKARQVMFQGFMVIAAFSVLLTSIALAIASPLPRWLGGGDDIAGLSTLYFSIYTASLPFFQLGTLASSMLKCSGNMRIPSLMSLLMCVLDVVFNFLLIFPSRHISLFGTELYIPGAGMGVAGAALGTVLAMSSTGLYLVWYAWFRSPDLSLRHERLVIKAHWSFLRNALRISAPMACQYVLMSVAQIVSTIIVAPLGNFAIAANTFAITAESLCYMPGYGIGEAATTLIGQSKGAGRTELCRSFAHFTVGIGVAVMAVMGTVMYVFAPEIMGLLTPVEEICSLGVSALRIEAFAEPMFAVSIVTYSVCVGAGDTLKPALINLCCIWFVRLSLAAYLAPLYGLPGVWMAMASELVVRGLLFLHRLFRGRWLSHAMEG